MKGQFLYWCSLGNTKARLVHCCQCLKINMLRQWLFSIWTYLNWLLLQHPMEASNKHIIKHIINRAFSCLISHPHILGCQPTIPTVSIKTAINWKNCWKLYFNVENFFVCILTKHFTLINILMNYIVREAFKYNKPKMAIWQLWTITYYHGISWTIMDYHGLSWTIMDYHRD